MTDSRSVDYGTCSVCGYTMLPVLAFSPCGHSAVIERRPLEETGVVYSWTRTRLGRDQLLVMADFLDGRLRVTAPMQGADHVEIGDRVRLVGGIETPYAYVAAS